LLKDLACWAQLSGFDRPCHFEFEHKLQKLAGSVAPLWTLRSQLCFTLSTQLSFQGWAGKWRCLHHWLRTFYLKKSKMSN